MKTQVEGHIVNVKPPRGDSEHWNGSCVTIDDRGEASILRFYGPADVLSPFTEIAMFAEVLLEGFVQARTNNFSGAAELSFRALSIKEL